jgi:hypothetical protein
LGCLKKGKKYRPRSWIKAAFQKKPLVSTFFRKKEENKENENEAD